MEQNTENEKRNGEHNLCSNECVVKKRWTKEKCLIEMEKSNAAKLGNVIWPRIVIEPRWNWSGKIHEKDASIWIFQSFFLVALREKKRIFWIFHSVYSTVLALHTFNRMNPKSSAVDKFMANYSLLGLVFNQEP